MATTRYPQQCSTHIQSLSALTWWTQASRTTTHKHSSKGLSKRFPMYRSRRSKDWTKMFSKAQLQLCLWLRRKQASRLQSSTIYQLLVSLHLIKNLSSARYQAKGEVSLKTRSKSPKTNRPRNLQLLNSNRQKEKTQLLRRKMKTHPRKTKPSSMMTSTLCTTWKTPRATMIRMILALSNFP